MKKYLLMLVLSLSLVGCSLPVVDRENELLNLSVNRPAAVKEERAVTIENGVPEPNVKFRGGQTKIELRGVSLKDVLQVIFQEVLQYPYVLEVDLKTDEKVYDISVNRGIKKSELYKMCVELISRSGLSVIDIDGVLYVNSEEKRKPEKTNIIAVYHGRNRKAVELMAAISPILTDEKKEDRSVVSTDNKRAIIIKGEETQVKKLLRVLADIDRPEKQIISSLQVLEVTMSGELRQGLEYYLKDVVGELSGVLASPQVVGNGFTFSLMTDNRIRAELSLLEKNGIVKVISRPIIITVDGKSSSLHVGTDIPILDTVKETDDDNLYQTVKYRNTGLKITINPNIISRSDLSVNLSVELSKGSENSLSSLDSPTIINRYLETSLNLPSGKSVIIAGIVSSTIDQSESHLPKFRWSSLLGSARHETDQTELIIILQCAIAETSNIDELSNEQFEKLKGIKND